jgi:dolichol-phosphate mannosyltransferase
VEALVVVPTYNERENIENVLDELLSLDIDLHVLVVDDNSPDGTGDVVDGYQARDSRIHVMHRPGKMGLGSAYIQGFKWALAETDARFLFEMDADFSHDPRAIPEFLAKTPEADLVIGSRYLHGITVMNWPLRRLALSVGANIYTRIVTGMPVKDATGGFNYHAWRRNYRIVEIPIVFVDRRQGASKMSRRIIYEAAFLVWKLRFASIFGRSL